MKQVVTFCIKHRVTTLLACILVVIFGVMGFTDLPLALTPDIELPMAVVYTSYAGAGPQEVESMVTRTIEQACASVAGMEELRSQSSEGTSMVMVTFVDGTNMDSAMTDLRDRIDRVKGFLPDGTDTPMTMALNPDALPVVEIGLKGADLASLQTIAEDTLSPALERIHGVASVDIVGGYQNEVAVKTYADRLNGYHLSVGYVAQILGAENLTLSGGSVSNGNQTLSVRTDGAYHSVEDIAAALIPLPTGGTVRLSEIADVSLAPQEQTNIAKLNGDPCIVLAVNKQSGVNTVQVATRVKNAMNDLTEQNPTLDWALLMDQSDFINLAVDSAIQNILLGVLLAAVVLFVFLRSWGSTAVISIAMPICIISVFLIMKAFGITLNMMSLGGIAMGVGMIVDNSIVVLENIYSFRNDGRSRYEACVFGTGEVALSISASTLTTVAVFLPIGVSGGLVGMMFRDFCVTITALLLMSLFIALTLVPLLCYMLLDRGETRRLRHPDAQPKVSKLDGWANRMMNRYRKALAFFINKRWVAVLTSVGLVVVFLSSFALCDTILMPTIDQGMITVTTTMPTGAELKETEAIGDRIAQTVLETVPELDSVTYTASSTSASTVLLLKPVGERSRSAEEIGNALREDLADIAGARIAVSSAGMFDMSAMTGAAISVTLSGDDYELLTETADQLVSEIAALPDAVEVKSSASVQVPEVDITIHRENASRFGLNAATIGSAVRAQLEGTTATRLKMNGEEINVTVSGDTRTGQSVDALKTIPLDTPMGTTVPLSLVADVEIVLAPQTITRLDQSRTVTVTGGSLTGDTTGIYQSVQQIMENFRLPEGITYEAGGEMESINESFGDLAFALVVGLGLVYFVLASQFESFLMPVIIMMILPVGLIGSLFGLPVTGQDISIVAFIGVIMLAGTVVNSSIVLIDYIKIRRRRGESKNEAILNACPRRVRPVLMTTLTTILGLLPMALGRGESSEMMVPMATVMITGMIVSTIVTLLFTPVYYSLIDSAVSHFTKKGVDARRDVIEEPVPAGVD